MASIRSSITIASLLILTSGVIPIGFPFPVAAKEPNTLSDETTYLIQKPTGFKAVFAVFMGFPSYSIDSQLALVTTMNKTVLA